MEATITGRGTALPEASLDEMEIEWQRAKGQT
jgi:uncharacterized protein YabN with tetrapyrrole methylase and pyrophosphatase domain